MNAFSPQTLFSLEGKVALVTGASGGIGSVLAQGLAAAGARVALVGRNQNRLEQIKQQIGAQAEVFIADLENTSAIQPLLQAVADTCGQIDVLVNCIGINQRQPMLEVKPETFAQILQVNLEGVYFLSQAVMQHMKQHATGGKIVHIGSLSAAVGLSGVSVYGMTKAALVQLTKTMAIEGAPLGIQVNCLCPGFIHTELTEALWQNEAKQRWMLERLPLNRAGKPADLVGMAVLMSSSASDYMTGQSVYIDGGFLAGSAW